MKFDAFPTSESRHAEASRGIVVIPTPLTPLEEFPLNWPYRITAALPYLALHQTKPCPSEDNHGTVSCLTTLPFCTSTNWQFNPCVSVRLRPSETGQSPRHRVYMPKHIHRSSLKHTPVNDDGSRLLQAADQVNTTKLRRPTNRVPAVPLSSRPRTEVLVRRFHGVHHK